MWYGASSLTSLTLIVLMGEAGTEALTESGAVRIRVRARSPGQCWGRGGPVMAVTVTT